jgi:hypothetical protein
LAYRKLAVWDPDNDPTVAKLREEITKNHEEVVAAAKRLGRRPPKPEELAIELAKAEARAKEHHDKLYRDVQLDGPTFTGEIK